MVGVLVLSSGMLLGAPELAAAQVVGASGDALKIPQDKLVQPAELNAVIKKGGKDAPLVLQVGSHVLFAEAHIAGSEYVGPGQQAAGLDALTKRVSGLAKDKSLIIYCGCCPWERCPNVGAAYKKLQELGFTKVKVLYLANNLGDDWVAKGYLVANGR